MTGLTLIAAGRIYADLVFTGLDADPQPGTEVFASGLQLTAGGGAFITASYAAALGLEAGVFGVVPAEPFDAAVISSLHQNGVAVHVAPAQPGEDAQLTAAIVRGNDRSFVTRRVGPAVPQDMPLPAARHLHIGEMTTALENPWLIEQARAIGATVSLDCGWDAAMFSDPRAAGIIESVDIFMPNRAEADRLKAAGVTPAPRAALVVKAGENGAEAWSGGAHSSAAALPAQVVDPTGAGDAFNAGFLAAWMAGESLQRCLDLAVACGADAVGRVGGAAGLPRLDALLAGVQAGTAQRVGSQR